MTINNLLQCPFCGGRAEVKCKHMAVNGYNGIVYRVRCALCYAQSPYRRNARLHGHHETLEQAVDAWNRRAKDA